MQNWKKHGHIFRPNNSLKFSTSHAQLPTVDIIDNKIWRIYFSTRDNNNRSRPTYIEVEAGNPKNILYVHDKPVLDIGEIGTFDDCGIIPCSIVNFNDKKYLYYAGWTVRNTIPYHNSIGLAVSEDNGKTFKKLFKGPVITINHTEPYFTGTSFVIIEDGIWKNWYLSCTKWEVVNSKPEPFYHIKYAESKDGIIWDRKGTIAIDYNSNNEAGINRASVLKENGIYKMWYATRGSNNYRIDTKNSYRIGYAESMDGINWNRMDEIVNIDISNEGWDSQMVSYPYIIKHNNTKFMFYNGNGFGQSGFGYATI